MRLGTCAEMICIPNLDFLPIRTNREMSKRTIRMISATDVQTLLVVDLMRSRQIRRTQDSEVESTDLPISTCKFVNLPAKGAISRCGRQDHACVLVVDVVLLEGPPKGSRPDCPENDYSAGRMSESQNAQSAGATN